LRSQTALVAALVNSAQLGIALTAWFKPAAVSWMQVEYCATVAPQSVGISLQPGLVAQAELGSARQGDSLLVQFDRSFSSVGALLDVAKDSPWYRQMVSVVTAVAKYAQVSSQSWVACSAVSVLSTVVPASVVTGSALEVPPVALEVPPVVPEVPPVLPEVPPVVPEVPPVLPVSSLLLQPAVAIIAASANALNNPIRLCRMRPQGGNCV
jgi:hypothetical protein